MEYSILSIPIELLSRIFGACDDFQQVIALASACKHTQTAWMTHSPSIIWSVGTAHIRSFDDALMAVRATALVLKAYQAGTIPPAVEDIKSLSGKSKLPDTAELKEILNMQRLVQCIEYMYFNSKYDEQKYPAAKRGFPDCLKEILGAENATIESFQEAFFRGMFRLSLAGAITARAYMGPVFEARKEGNSQFYKAWGDERWWSEELESLSFEDQDPYPKDTGLDYIRRHPVYNFDVLDSSEIGQWRDREYEACFGPFATWIIEDGRKRLLNEFEGLTQPDWAENRSDIGAVRELMLLLVAYEHFNHCLRSTFGRLGNGSAYKPPSQGSRTVSIVRFGVFQVEEITIPETVEDLINAPLIAQSHPALESSAGKHLKYQIDVEQVIFDLQIRTRTPIPFHYEHQGPPGTLELWRYALKQYLNLTLRPKTFWIPPDCECIWWRLSSLFQIGTWCRSMILLLFHGIGEIIEHSSKIHGKVSRN